MTCRQTVHQVWRSGLRLLRLLVWHLDEGVSKQLLNCGSFGDIWMKAIPEEVVAHLRDTLGECRWMLGLRNDLHYALGVLAIRYPRWLPREHLVNTAAQWPDIGVLGSTETFDDLWCHPVWWAFDLIISGCLDLLDAGGLLTTVCWSFVAHWHTYRMELCWRTEIGHLHLAQSVH